MKRLLNSLVLTASLVYGINLAAQNNEPLVCADYYAEVDFESIGLNLSHFDFRGDIDSCHARSNDSYPYDDLLYISVYNGYDEDSSMEDYEDDVSAYQGVDGYSEVADLGEKAYIQITEKLGRLDHAFIGVVTGIYTIRIEVNGDYSNGANNRFNSTTVLDIARIIVDALED